MCGNGAIYVDDSRSDVTGCRFLKCLSLLEAPPSFGKSRTPTLRDSGDSVVNELLNC